MRERLNRLPDGTWETVDYIDMDPTIGDGMIPIRVKMTITGDLIHYDLTGSHDYIKCFLNSGIGVTWSAIAAGTKTFFPDIPLNSGFLSHQSHFAGGKRGHGATTRGHRGISVWVVRKDNEFDFRALVPGHARASIGMFVQP